MTDPHIVRREEVMAYLDGELSGERARAAARHLETCEDCGRVARGWRQASDKLAAWQVEPSPDRIAATVLDAAAREADGPSRRSGVFAAFAFPTWALAAASIGGVVLVGVIGVELLRAPAIGDRAAERPEALQREAAVQPPASEKSEARSQADLASSPAAPMAMPVEPAAARPSVRRDERAAANEAAPPLAAVVDPKTVTPGRLLDQTAAGIPAQAAPPPPPPPAAPLPTLAETVTVTAAAPKVATANAQVAQGGQATGAVAGRGGSGTFAARQDASAGTPAPRTRVMAAIARTAAMSLVVDRFDDARPAIERVVQARGGRIGSLTVTSEPASRRALDAVLRVPVLAFEATLADLRALGRLSQESQATDDMTGSLRDLDVRLTNARQEETRLRDLLQRPADLRDPLAVQQELARVRTDLERMQAEQRDQTDRVALATITIRLDEGRSAAPSTPSRTRR